MSAIKTYAKCEYCEKIEQTRDEWNLPHNWVKFTKYPTAIIGKEDYAFCGIEHLWFWCLDNYDRSIIEKLLYKVNAWLVARK
jgi:hypothetical protein